MAETQTEDIEIPKEEGVPVEERDRFYGDSIQSLFLLIVILGIMAVVFLGLNVLLFKRSVPPPLYFQATEQGQILIESPLDKPNIATNELLNWVVEAMMSAHTFNFMNYSRAIDNAKEYFTPDGYMEYLSVLNKVNILERLKKNKLVLVAAPREAPEILKEGPFANRYLWKIKVPMGFMYRNVITNITDNVDVTILVMRVPTTQSPSGISILKYNIEIKR